MSKDRSKETPVGHVEIVLKDVWTRSGNLRIKVCNEKVFWCMDVDGGPHQWSEMPGELLQFLFQKKQSREENLETFVGEFAVEISDIVNRYGNLTIKRCKAGYFWAIGSELGPFMEWKEINEDMFRLLWRHEQNCKAKAKGIG